MAEGQQGFQPGRAKTGGRVKGMKDLSLILWEQLMERYKANITDGTFVSPMGFYVDLLNDTSQPIEIRDRAADKLAKYFHQSMPTLVEQTITSETPIFNINFTNETDESDD